MVKQVNKRILLILLILFSLILISAFLNEYKLDHQPCKLCIYQRIPYFLAILLIVKIFFIKKYEKITLLILFFIFIGSTALAFYHFGIEQGFFSESLACSTDEQLKSLSKEELLEQLKQNSISCKDVSFRIFGLSRAAINSIFSLLLSVLFIKIFLSYGKN